MSALASLGGHHEQGGEAHVARAMFLSVHCVCVRSAQAMRALLRSHDLVLGARAEELLLRQHSSALHGSLVALVFCHLLCGNSSRRMRSVREGRHGGSLNLPACGCAHFEWGFCSAPV